MSGPPTPCLLAPTASGKTAVALALARRTRGEVVSCDAYAVYRGMAILTAAPASSDVPHHLVGDLDPAETFSAARFVQAAEALVPLVRARGGTPWIVGGTALYLRAWLKGFGARVGRDEGLRARLRAQAEAEGPGALHARLAAADPERARSLHPHDVRRVVRAIEIIEATGRPASALRGGWAAPDRHPARLIGLRRSREDLDQRIRRRTAAMFEAGVVEEVRRLLARPLSAEARQVLGLETIARLLAGALDRAGAEEEIVRRTRRLVRKQQTFFSSFEGVRWLDLAPDEDAGTTAERVLAAAGDLGGPGQASAGTSS